MKIGFDHDDVERILKEEAERLFPNHEADDILFTVYGEEGKEISFPSIEADVFLAEICNDNEK